MEKTEKDQCFVIMPIGELDTYPKDHFKQVYEDLLCPAIQEAGYEPKRADDDKSSSMIQVSIIRDIIESPMAVCDLSTRNPNVLFELGVRQAFDLPVVLVQEKDTPRIFDISTINTVDYRKNLIYREVIEDRKKIIDAIKETKDNKKGINSIIKLLNLGKAQINERNTLSENEETNLLLYSILNRFDKWENIYASNYNMKDNLTFLEEKNNIESRRIIETLTNEFWEMYKKYGEEEARRYIKDIGAELLKSSNLTARYKKQVLSALNQLEKAIGEKQ